MTYASTPSTCPSVAGIRSSRSEVSALIERSSVPDPTIGIVTTATSPRSFVLTLTGSFMSPVSIACARNSRTAPATSGVLTSSAETTTSAGSGLPGNAAWMRS